MNPSKPPPPADTCVTVTSYPGSYYAAQLYEARPRASDSVLTWRPSAQVSPLTRSERRAEMAAIQHAQRSPGLKYIPGVVLGSRAGLE